MRISALVSSIALVTCVGVNAVAAAHDSALRGGNDVVDLADTVEVKPIHCQMKPWGPWGPCGIDGYKERHREVDVMPNDIGRACPFNTQRVKCRKQDCVVCDWKEGECDKSSGKKRFWREIIRQPELDGEPCPSPADLERFDDCDVDCEAVSPPEYTEDACNANGERRKHPKIKYDKKNNGAACPPPIKMDNCPPEPCKFKTKDEDTSTPFGNCELDGSDHHYYKQRTLAIDTPAKYGGECKPEDGLDKRECPKENCEYVPIPADTPYGTCALEASSGNYFKSRDRVVAKQARYGGSDCVPDRLPCIRDCYGRRAEVTFLSSYKDLKQYTAILDTEAKCCEHCKSISQCGGYAYYRDVYGCFVMTVADIIDTTPNSDRADSAYVGWV